MRNQTTLPDGYLSEEQVARLLDVKVSTLRVWAATRKGPPRVVVGRRPLYREESLNKWLLEHERDFTAERKAARAGRGRKRVPELV